MKKLNLFYFIVGFVLLAGIIGTGCQMSTIGEEGDIDVADDYTAVVADDQEGRMRPIETQPIQLPTIPDHIYFPTPTPRKITWPPVLNGYILRPSQDGRVFSVYPNHAADYATYFASHVGSWDGKRGKVRSLIQFNLSTIPAGSKIKSAKLHLFHYPHHNYRHSGWNESVLKRITRPWNAATANWNNQPPTTMTNSVTLRRSTHGKQDYVVDVTGMINDMRRTGNYGMMLFQKDEIAGGQLYFASSEYSDRAYQPYLKITLGEKINLENAERVGLFHFKGSGGYELHDASLVYQEPNEIDPAYDYYFQYTVFQTRTNATNYINTYWDSNLGAKFLTFSYFDHANRLVRMPAADNYIFSTDDSTYAWKLRGDAVNIRRADYLDVHFNHELLETVSDVYLRIWKILR